MSSSSFDVIDRENKKKKANMQIRKNALSYEIYNTSVYEKQ
jgi:hypothetical protein